jgi:phosphopantothenoylcysteine decarboxylase
MERHLRVVVGCTGSVASVKVPAILGGLKERNADVQVIATEASLHFFSVDSLSVPVHRDRDEWNAWKNLSDPVLHIELRRWADVMLIAPLDANTLAKISHGICDNLLTCTVRAWDMNRPLLFCPAMNTYMWEHPFTAKQVATLEELGYRQIAPVVKQLACGDFGQGAMAEVETIIDTVMDSKCHD